MTNTKYVQVPVEVVQRLRDIEGCFEAARVEGLEQALAETTDERLKDLIVRRLSWASTYANDALHLIAAAPQQAQAGEAEREKKLESAVHGMANDLARIQEALGLDPHMIDADKIIERIAALQPQPQAVDERDLINDLRDLVDLTTWQQDVVARAAKVLEARASLSAQPTPVAAEQCELSAKDCTINSFNPSNIDGYIRLLTWVVWCDHYREKSPNFHLSADTFGVLTQLDNMLTGWKDEPKPPKEVINAVREILGMNASSGDERRNARREARHTLKVWLRRLGHAPQNLSK